MTQELKRSFLEQFSNSKKAVSNWPAWMRESSVVAVASLPRAADKAQGANAPVQENQPQETGHKQ